MEIRSIFCSAKARTMPKEYDQVRYDLCSVSFDPATRRFGTVVDTLYKASEIDKSVLFPGFPGWKVFALYLVRLWEFLYLA